VESESDTSPRARFRFGFSGRRKRAKPPEDTVISSDDILDSLTRQASSQVGLGEQQTRSLEVLTEMEDVRPLSESSASSLIPLRPETNRSAGRYVIVVMCFAGLLVVWLYSSGRRIFDVFQLDNLVQKIDVQSVFSNPAQFGIISSIAMVIAFWVALRRRASRLQISL
jgi:hypothetical protein